MLEARPDVLCYTTPILEHPVTVVGSGRLVLYVHSTAPSTDFVGRVCDVSPDGRSMNVCDGLLRLHLDEEKNQVQKDGSRRIEIELWPTAYTFLSGHRIRLQVSSAAHPLQLDATRAMDSWLAANTESCIPMVSLFEHLAGLSDCVGGAGF